MAQFMMILRSSHEILGTSGIIQNPKGIFVWLKFWFASASIIDIDCWRSHYTGILMVGERSGRASALAPVKRPLLGQ